MAIPAAVSRPRHTVQRPALRVVATPRRTRPFLLALAVFAALGVFTVVGLNAVAAEHAFTARTLEGSVDELTAQYEELRAHVAALEAPDRIRGVAVEELGMVPADAPAFLVLEQRSATPQAAGAQRRVSVERR